MLELTPGLDVTVGPLVGGAGSLPRAVERAAEAGFMRVHLSAAIRGIRPRELDKRARRDVLSMLSRAGVMLGGLDLMIPHRDWLQSDTQDRAVAAAVAAIELAADWGKAPLAMTLPVERLEEDIERELLTVADGCGVVLAVHAEHDVAALKAWLEGHDQPILGAAMDPAALLASGQDVSAAVTSLGNWLRVARLDDYREASTLGSGGRCSVGEGELDVVAYRAALAVCTKLRSVVLELRDVPDAVDAMHRGKREWDRGEPGLA